MAYDKVVDSSVLDAGLKAIADAIREKGGTSDNLAFPTGMAAAVSAIQTGGGGAELPERKLFCTLTAEMTWKQIIEANPIPLRYEKALYWFLVDGDNAATQGSTTYKWLYINVDASDTSVDNTAKFIVYSYKNGLVSPNSMGRSNTVYGLAGSYVTTKNNAITSVNMGSYVGAGNSIYLQEIPFDILNCRFDFTELG